MPLKDSNTAPAASLPDASAETRLALTAALLFNALRGLLVLLLLGLGILIPFLAVNKTGASVVLLSVALFMLVIPYVVLRRGKIMQAAWSFSVSGAVISTVLLIFSGGLAQPSDCLPVGHRSSRDNPHWAEGGVPVRRCGSCC